MACADLGDELLCSICLNIYADPVTLRCGHNFCRECIEDVLDTLEGSEAYTCPDCRAEFQECPTMQRNVTLCNIAEKFQSTRSDQVGATLLCTYCIHSATPAVKSCLHCEALLCDGHLRVHSKSEEHVLTDPIVFLEAKRCPIHNKVLQYYCPEDATCICLLCRLAGDHIGHQVEPLDEAVEKKKKQLGNVLKTIIQNREIAEKRLQSLKEQQHELEEKTAGNPEAITDLFSSIRRTLDDQEKKVLSYFSRQDVSLISDQIRQMEIKKDEMYRRIRHLEELCHTADPWSILQEPPSSQEDSFVVREEAISVESPGPPPADSMNVVRSLEILSTAFTDLMTQMKRQIYGPEEVDVLLDIRTAGINVEISEDLKMAAWSQIKQIQPGARKNRQRCQVLSTGRFSSGRHFWDVETSKSGTWSLGVCYPSMPRSGDKAEIGYNNKSGCLTKFYNGHQYSVMHNGKEILIGQETPCNRFRLYLDYEAGQLSFYELRDPIRLLHIIYANFKEPLHAAFYVCNAWVRIQS